MAVMIFNPSTLEQREVGERDADRAVTDMGWIRLGGSNLLVAVYRPGDADHKMVLERDLVSWEQKGYHAEPTVVYHPEEGSKTVPAAEAKKMLGKGWYDSPAKFPVNQKTAKSE